MREIQQIVAEVRPRRAGGQGREQGGRHGVRFGRGRMRGGEGREHERVLDPLVGAQGAQPRATPAGDPRQQPRVRVQRPQFPREARREGDADGAPRAGPDSQVAALVSDVVEPLLAEALDQRRRLRPARQIGAAVGGEPARGAHRLGQRRDHEGVGGGRQPHLAPRGAGGGDLVEHGRVQHQRRRRHGRRAGDAPLQRRAPRGEPERQGEERQRTGRDQPQDAFDQQVARDQRSVHVDDQRRRAAPPRGIHRCVMIRGRLARSTAEAGGGEVDAPRPRL